MVFMGARQLVEINDVGGPFSISIDGSLILEESSAHLLVERAMGLRETNPFAIQLDADVRLSTMDSDSRDVILGALTPAWDADEEALHYEFEDQGNEAGGQWLAVGVDRGLTIDHVRWTWFTTNGGDFQPAPSSEGEVRIALWASWEGPGMTSGMWKEVACRTWGDQASLTFKCLGEDAAQMAITYQTRDVRLVVQELCQGFFEERGSQICPRCEESWEWNIHLELGDFPEDFIGEQIACLWWPCQKHQDGDDPPRLSNICGQEWHWLHGRWQVWIAPALVDT